jgi:hypothetical protein
MQGRIRVAPCATVVALCAIFSCAAPRALKAQEHWIERGGARPFVVRADYQIANPQQLLGELRQLEHDLHRMLAIGPSAESVELYLFRDHASYQQYMSRRYPGVPARRALYVKGSGPGMVYAYDSRDLAVDLRHETTHALLHASLRAVPLWLDEGLAEYFEVPAEMRLKGNPHLRDFQTPGHLPPVVRLTTLENLDDLSQMGREEYRSAWAWVHFCLHGPLEARQELHAYLADVKTGRNAAPLSQRLERRLPGVERRLAAHLDYWRR